MHLCENLNISWADIISEANVKLWHKNVSRFWEKKSKINNKVKMRLIRFFSRWLVLQLLCQTWSRFLSAFWVSGRANNDRVPLITSLKKQQKNVVVKSKSHRFFFQEDGFIATSGVVNVKVENIKKVQYVCKNISFRSLSTRLP